MLLLLLLVCHTEKADQAAAAAAIAAHPKPHDQSEATIKLTNPFRQANGRQWTAKQFCLLLLLLLLLLCHGGTFYQRPSITVPSNLLYLIQLFFLFLFSLCLPFC